MHAADEGNTLRGIERQFGLHRDTIMRLVIPVANGCKAFMDGLVRRLECLRVQVDEQRCLSARSSAAWNLAPPAARGR